MSQRDMSKKQFDEACASHGFKAHGFLGYYELPCKTMVSILNAGNNRRQQVAYLIRMEAKFRRQI